MQNLQVGLSAWITQDGNYGEFEVGREYKFALEFHAPDIVIDSGPSRASSLTPSGNAKYRGHGSVIFCSDEGWVIDVGVPMYREERTPSHARIGSRVEGDLHVGIDPFFYFERLAALPRARDESKTSFVDVNATDAWNDDDGHAHYLLECEQR